MLGKLFKYELKSTARWMLPAYLFVILMSVVNMSFILIDVDPTGTFGEMLLNTIGSFCMMLYFMSVVSISLVTLLVAVIRFYKNLLSNEGYISMTLPVSIDHHLLVKLGTAFLWMIITTFVVLLSFVIITAPEGIIKDIWIVFDEMFMYLPQVLGNKTFGFVVSIFLNMVFGVVQSITMCYFAMALGQLSNKHKIGMAIVAYMGVSFAVQIIGSILLVNFITAIALVSEVFDALNSLLAFFWVSGIGTMILSAIFYFGTRYILVKKINLQ